MSRTPDTDAAASAATLSVAVLAGGRSSEHDVSLSSGAAVHEGLREAGHRVVAVEIGRDGVWRHNGQPLNVTPAAGLLGVDVVFPVLHGPFGEDGTVQGLLEILDVAYVGAGVAASAVCLDKVLFKQLMAALGVPQVDYVGVRAARFKRARAKVLDEVARLGVPVFVKPAHLGSSLGIVKVSDAADVEAALQAAFAHDELVIVEAMAVGSEVECGVLGLLDGEGVGGGEPEPDEAFASKPGEIVFSGEFYDYGAKYTPGAMDLRIPAGISAIVSEQVRRLAVRAFLAAGCDGLARVDFFVDGDRVLVNELNTMPGFTPTSVYAKLLASSGVPYPRLLDRLCRLACERHDRRRTYSY
jgi:D-alanine-D-alanine ligase